MDRELTRCPNDHPAESSGALLLILPHDTPASPAAAGRHASRTRLVGYLVGYSLISPPRALACESYSQNQNHPMNTPIIEPYLFFNGRCEEALEFYENTLGAKRVMLMRFDEAPDSPPEGMLPADWGQKVMHASLRVGECMVMMSDGCGPQDGGFHGFSLSIAPPDEAEARRIFGALANGGTVQMALDKTFWSPCYGMLTDRFGLSWMINVVA
jgi:PhnB protein